MARPKVTVVGAGNVGGTAAQRLVEKNICDVVLVDIVPGVPQGKALDLLQAGPVYRYSSTIVGTNGYEETAGSSVAIITSGVPRKPGMTRDDLLSTNAKIVAGVVKELVARSPNVILVLVTNPLDAMTYVAHKLSGLPKQRVMGMAGVLDSARLRTFIAMELGVDAPDVQAMVLGGHGDTMVPLLAHTTVNGKPLADRLSKDRWEVLVKRTREGGAEIVNLLKSGSAFYAPSAAVVEMVEAILSDQHKVLPCAVRCDGEYGINGLFVGVPARLGKGGVEAIVEMALTAEEKSALAASAAAVKELCAAVDRLLPG
ncbi:MAG TPA: malate dehydrogenase [Nitrospirales bacterium]|nr:malate dehydrogenase [Nitrospirales bacterium]